MFLPYLTYNFKVLLFCSKATVEHITLKISYIYNIIYSICVVPIMLQIGNESLSKKLLDSSFLLVDNFLNHGRR